MDDLQFRRTIYANPQSQDEEAKQAAAKDESKQIFWDELKKFDEQLTHAVNVEVPEGLADRLLLKQSFQQHNRADRRRRAYMGLAASIVTVFGVSAFLWQQQANSVSISEHALAHVYHEEDAYHLSSQTNVSLEQVNQQLSDVGVRFSEAVGRIYFARHCIYKGVSGVHMLIQGAQGKVTVFVIPRDQVAGEADAFADGRMHGQTLIYNNAYVVMLAETQTAFDDLKQQVKKNLVYSA